MEGPENVHCGCGFRKETGVGVQEHLRRVLLRQEALECDRINSFARKLRPGGFDGVFLFDAMASSALSSCSGGGRSSAIALELGKLHLGLHEELHPLQLQLLDEPHPLPLHLHHLLQLRALHTLIHLSEVKDGPGQFPQALPSVLRSVRRRHPRGRVFLPGLPLLSIHRLGGEAAGGIRRRRRRRRCGRHGGRLRRDRAGPRIGKLSVVVVLLLEVVEGPGPDRDGHGEVGGGGGLVGVVVVGSSGGLGLGERGLWQRRRQRGGRGRGLVRGVVVVGAEEVVEALEEGPLGGAGGRGSGAGLLEFVLLLEGVDAVLALDVGLGGLGIVVAGAHDVGHLLPVLLPEIPPAQLQLLGWVS
ncbi:hypothetical protein Taro_001691 [Colocasia esculenta]|uniref:Uncharacterized protein n=1 Tax=Colocasia esculenta TaxID=4460 RepID=A0A843TGL8_COLES|nr:hypothetical protein [Colocasia esculenta]